MKEPLFRPGDKAVYTGVVDSKWNGKVVTVIGVWELPDAEGFWVYDIKELGRPVGRHVLENESIYNSPLMRALR